MALLDLQGVGWVTAHKITERFPTYESLLACPHEQILIRIKGTANAESLVKKLRDKESFGSAVDRTKSLIKGMKDKNMAVLASGHPNWPTHLDKLDRPIRPVVLHTFGDTAALKRSGAAMFGLDELDADAFESAQLLADRLIEADIPLVSAARTGFDTILHKRTTAANRPCIMVARCGLAKIDKQARASVASAVQSGGVLVSPFAMTHGPFDHDDTERAILQSALAGPSVFFGATPHTPEFHAMQWAVEQNKPVFAHISVKEYTELPLQHIHVIERSVDYDWVIAAAKGES